MDICGDRSARSWNPWGKPLIEKVRQHTPDKATPVLPSSSSRATRREIMARRFIDLCIKTKEEVGGSQGFSLGP